MRTLALPPLTQISVTFKQGSKLISTPSACQRLEPQFLAELGLTAEFQAYKKKLSQRTTAAKYRQQKFKLLREDTEGYSKVIGELAAAASDNASSIKVGAEKKEELHDRAARVWKHLESIIGMYSGDEHFRASF